MNGELPFFTAGFGTGNASRFVYNSGLFFEYSVSVRNLPLCKLSL